jgi:hypothetical protein
MSCSATSALSFTGNFNAWSRIDSELDCIVLFLPHFHTCLYLYLQLIVEVYPNQQLGKSTGEILWEGRKDGFPIKSVGNDKDEGGRE